MQASSKCGTRGGGSLCEKPSDASAARHDALRVAGPSEATIAYCPLMFLRFVLDVADEDVLPIDHGLPSRVGTDSPRQILLASTSEIST